MAKDPKKEAAEEALRLLKEEAELRARMNSGYDEYIKAVKEAHALQKTLNKNTAIEAEIREAINTGKRNGVALTDDEIEVEKEKLKILEKQNKLMSKQVELYKSAAKEANTMAMALGKAGKGLFKLTASLPGMVKKGLSQIKDLGLDEFDKAMKQSALSMGILSKESGGFRNNLKSVAKETSMMGVNLKQLAELQSSYSENLGRTVVLSKEGLKGLAQMSKMTGLGAEGASQMAADMDLQGYSAERTAQFTEETLKASHKMGVNATKVMKNLSGNLKLMNKYRFQEGAKGLAKMAQLVTKLGVDMNAVSGTADKLWNIEGAVEMSAQLNVMGGAWAQMSDPFHLMYMARNDMAGLTEEIANAAKETIQFNKKTGEFDMSAEGMHRLKIIAEQTGMAYEDLVTMGKNAKKFDEIKSQVGFTIGGSDEDKAMLDYISSKSEIKNGKARIMINGEPKLLSQLSQADKDVIKSQMAQKESMEEQAKRVRSFDEQLTYFIDQLKVYLLPFLEELNKNLMPKLDKLASKFNTEGWGKSIEEFAKSIGSFVSTIGSWIIEHPKLTAAIWAFSKAAPLITGAFKLFGGIWETVKWFKNGIALGEGFNSVASAGGGGGSILDELSGGRGKKRGFNFKRTMTAFKKGGLKGGLKSIGRQATSYFKPAANVAGKTSSKFAGKAAGKVLGKGLGMAASKIPLIGSLLSLGKDQVDFFSSKSMRKTGVGGWLESLGGAGMDMIDWIPGINQLTEMSGLGVNNMATDNLANARAVYRSRYPDAPTVIPNKLLFKDIRKNPGAYPDDVVEDADDVTAEDLEDGIIRPGRGRHVIKNEFGKTWITKSGDGLAVSPNISEGGNSVNHNFGEMTINGTIRIEGPGGAEINPNILKDESFKRQVAKVVQDEMIKRVSMGKMKG
jgi:hypothetical protein